MDDLLDDVYPLARSLYRDAARDALLDILGGDPYVGASRDWNALSSACLRAARAYLTQEAQDRARTALR